MPLYYKQQTGDLLLGIWKMEETVEELLSFLDNTDYYSQSLSSFKSERRIKEWLSVRVLLKYLCDDEKLINYLATGKPYLEDKSYHISISHTNGYVAVILHPSCDVGIDIEQRSAKVSRVKSKFLQSEEEAHVPVADEINYLLLCWSAKETVYKTLNIEDVELKQHLQILPFQLQEQDNKELVVRELKTGYNKQFSVEYLIYPDFVLTYTVVSL